MTDTWWAAAIWFGIMATIAVSILLYEGVMRSLSWLWKNYLRSVFYEFFSGVGQFLENAGKVFIYVLIAVVVMGLLAGLYAIVSIKFLVLMIFLIILGLTIKGVWGSRSY